MTRGTGIFIYNDEKGQLSIDCSVEFNGDMYAKGNGQNFLNLISKSQTPDEFCSNCEEFNRTKGYYNYTDSILLRKHVKLLQSSIVPFLHKTMILSDYLFIKNTSDTVVSMRYFPKRNQPITKIRPGENFNTICNNERNCGGFTGLKPILN